MIAVNKRQERRFTTVSYAEEVADIDESGTDALGANKQKVANIKILVRYPHKDIVNTFRVMKVSMIEIQSHVSDSEAPQDAH